MQEIKEGKFDWKCRIWRFIENIVIKQRDIYPIKSYSSEIRRLEGIFNTYRYRFGEDRVNQISCEVVRIFVKDNQLYMKWWFLLDVRKMKEFTGVIVFVGDCLWFISHNSQIHGRFRVCASNRSEWYQNECPIRTGIILGTSPNWNRSTPITRYVVFEKVYNPSKKDELRKYVFHTNESEFSNDRKSKILKCISKDLQRE